MLFPETMLWLIVSVPDDNERTAAPLKVVSVKSALLPVVRPFFSIRLARVTAAVPVMSKIREFCCASMMVVDDPLPLIVTVSLISICPRVRSNSVLFVDAAKVIVFIPGLLFASTIASRRDSLPELMLPSSSSVVVLTTIGLANVNSS